MILLEEVSPYQNAYEFLVFEENDELDIGEAKARLSVFLIGSIDERLQPLLLILVHSVLQDFDPEEIRSAVIREIVFPVHFQNYSCKVVKG
ncbi:MAG: hypothetical protein Q4A75_01105 [Peptostreptococcaceae bacterium]|nr:hypothetical protein [Peptostreptococcaceae bacterium]